MSEAQPGRLARVGSIYRKFVQEVFDYQGNNNTRSVKTKSGQIIPTFGRGGAARPKVAHYGNAPQPAPAVLHVSTASAQARPTIQQTLQGHHDPHPLASTFSPSTPSPYDLGPFTLTTPSFQTSQEIPSNEIWLQPNSPKARAPTSSLIFATPTPSVTHSDDTSDTKTVLSKSNATSTDFNDLPLLSAPFGDGEGEGASGLQSFMNFTSTSHAEIIPPNLYDHPCTSHMPMVYHPSFSHDHELLTPQSILHDVPPSASMPNPRGISPTMAYRVQSSTILPVVADELGDHASKALRSEVTIGITGNTTHTVNKYSLHPITERARQPIGRIEERHPPSPPAPFPEIPPLDTAPVDLIDNVQSLAYGFITKKGRSRSGSLPSVSSERTRWSNLDSETAGMNIIPPPPVTEPPMPPGATCLPPSLPPESQLVNAAFIEHGPHSPLEIQHALELFLAIAQENIRLIQHQAAQIQMQSGGLGSTGLFSLPSSELPEFQLSCSNGVLLNANQLGASIDDSCRSTLQPLLETAQSRNRQQLHPTTDTPHDLSDIDTRHQLPFAIRPSNELGIVNAVPRQRGWIDEAPGCWDEPALEGSDGGARVL
ncbi:hypothetical protein FRB94_007493 [Tulasnella sp. JGI-2019a]|nr:hypothetical protein FRB94_007493 [Tulasnella sp. JGI-2019a]